MASPQNIDDLEVVGYANALKESMLPSVVPPVFRLKIDCNRTFVPPYSFNAGLLYNSTELPQTELRDRSEAGEITLFAEPFPARTGFELWIDQSFHENYEPKYEAWKNYAPSQAGQPSSRGRAKKRRFGRGRAV
jgi:hypothetical protein